MKPELYTPKVLFHTSTHFFGVFGLILLTIAAPLWAVFLVIIAHQIHMKVLGNCFLTRYAWHEGVMRGFSYWEYVPYLFGDTHYKRTGKYIDYVIKAVIIVTLITRITLLAL